MSAAPEQRKLSQRAQIGVALGTLVVVAALGFFVLVSPKRSAAAELDTRIVDVQAQVVRARSASLATSEAVKAADVFRLAKAMPDQQDMPGILLELSRIAADAGIVFETIRPGTAVVQEAYLSVPITLTFQGNFYSLSDFLFRLRSLVRVRDGELSSTGRLFAVSGVTFSEAQDGFPDINAELNVNAFVYGTADASRPPVPEPAETQAEPAPTSTDGAAPEGDQPPAESEAGS